MIAGWLTANSLVTQSVGLISKAPSGVNAALMPDGDANASYPAYSMLPTGC
ncbi:hypothetical protein ITL14_003351 [Salmonella enterica]|nr:hypothetical protein [Salmonella enterica]EIJ0491134.1 hypothetical protein [Salmonella enterica]